MKRRATKKRIQKYERMAVAVLLQKAMYMQNRYGKRGTTKEQQRANHLFLERMKKKVNSPQSTLSSQQVKLTHRDYQRLKFLGQLPSSWPKRLYQRWLRGLKKWQLRHPILYLGLVLSCVGLLSFGLVMYWGARQAPLYQIEGKSMEPTLHAGQQVKLTTQQPIQRFDLVVFQSRLTKELYLKRIIGLPQEHICYLDGKLFVNGQFVEDPFAQLTADIDFGKAFAQVVIAREGYLVLGDNRQDSYDSRQFGWVKHSEIKGLVDKKTDSRSRF